MSITAKNDFDEYPSCSSYYQERRIRRNAKNRRIDKAFTFKRYLSPPFKYLNIRILLSYIIILYYSLICRKTDLPVEIQEIIWTMLTEILFAKCLRSFYNGRPFRIKALDCLMGLMLVSRQSRMIAYPYLSILRDNSVIYKKTALEEEDFLYALRLAL
jgi:hypothetical protein